MHATNDLVKRKMQDIESHCRPMAANGYWALRVCSRHIRRTIACQTPFFLAPDFFFLLDSPRLTVVELRYSIFVNESIFS